MLTKQEMFDRVFIGLRSQGFTRCVDERLQCVYADGNGRHCAWGWVDTTLGADTFGTVHTLCMSRVGLAAELSVELLEFASELQRIHDSCIDSDLMEDRLYTFALTHGLSIPEAA